MEKKTCKKLIVAVVTAILLCVTAAMAKENTMDGTARMAQNAENAQEIAAIQALYQKMFRAMVDKDMKAMAEVHDASFVLVHMTGSRMNCDEYFDAVKDGTLNYYSAEHDDMEVKITGDTATLTAKSRVTAAVYGGGKHTWRLQQNMKLKKIGGKWKFTFSQASTY